MGMAKEKVRDAALLALSGDVWCELWSSNEWAARRRSGCIRGATGKDRTAQGSPTNATPLLRNEHNTTIVSPNLSPVFRIRNGTPRCDQTRPHTIPLYTDGSKVTLFGGEGREGLPGR